MYTLKFVRSFDDSSQKSVALCVSCKCYRVDAFEKCTLVTIFESAGHEKGVEIGLFKEDKVDNSNESKRAYYTACYVENINGKTIDVITP